MRAAALGRTAAFCAAAALAAAGGPARADGDACFDRAAQELLRGVEDKWRGDGAARFAVTPFDPEDAPVDEAVAEEAARALESALVRAAGAGVEIKLRTGLGDLFGDLWRDEAFGASYLERALRLVREARSIDVTAVGEWRPAENGYAAGFRAVDVARGAVLAASGAGCPVAAPPPRSLGLDDAVRAVAARLAEQAPKAETLLTAGIRYRDTGARTEFSRLLQDRLVEALRARFGDAVTGRVLAARPLAAGAAAPGEPGAYALDGAYWVWPDRVEFHAALHDSRGSVASARATARRDAALDGVQMVPAGDFRFLTVNDGLGPFRFDLRTPQGRAPELAVGDELRLVVRSEEDAWLSCYYWARDDRGDYALYKIYPHEAAAEGAGALSAGRLYAIPAEGETMGIRIGPPAGVELVKCVAADRDVSGELRFKLGVREMTRLPPGAAEGLSRAFRDTGARVAEASVTINVVEGEAPR